MDHTPPLRPRPNSSKNGTIEQVATFEFEDKSKEQAIKKERESLREVRLKLNQKRQAYGQKERSLREILREKYPALREQEDAIEKLGCGFENIEEIEDQIQDMEFMMSISA
eukprot:3578490-Amphidinium_carterae.1